MSKKTCILLKNSLLNDLLSSDLLFFVYGRRQKFLKRILLFLIFLNCYFIVNIFKGQKNIFRYLKIRQSLEIKKTELERMKFKSNEIRNIIKLLSQDNPDRDYIDQLLREKMNLSKANEKVIILDR